MSRDNFEDEIALLYQQRKQQVVAPEIRLQEQPDRNKYSPIKLLCIFLTGGMASFGILAVISHLSTSPVNTVSPIINSQTIELIDEIPPRATKNSLAIISPLPDKPQISTPASLPQLIAKEAPEIQKVEPTMIRVNLIKVLTLPNLTAPKLLIEPIYKVLPEYPLNARNKNQVGEVKLSYQIDPTGKVNSIMIISSTVNRDIQRSTKKALAQWLYPPSDALAGHHEVIFEFTIATE